MKTFPLASFFRLWSKFFFSLEDPLFINIDSWPLAQILLSGLSVKETPFDQTHLLYTSITLENHLGKSHSDCVCGFPKIFTGPRFGSHFRCSPQSRDQVQKPHRLDLRLM